ETVWGRAEGAVGKTGGQRERDPRLEVANGASGLEAIPGRAAHLRDCGSGRGYRRAGWSQGQSDLRDGPRGQVVRAPARIGHDGEGGVDRVPRQPRRQRITRDSTT